MLQQQLNNPTHTDPFADPFIDLPPVLDIEYQSHVADPLSFTMNDVSEINPDGFEPGPTVRSIGNVRAAITERITRAELERRQQADQAEPVQDIYTVLAALNDHLPDLHKLGKELHAACPSCGHNRPADARGKSDRFFSTDRTNYQFWTCRQCSFTTTTGALLGLAPGYTNTHRPIVKNWDQQDHDAEMLRSARLAYKDLAEFSHRHLDRAMPYLFGRGITEEVAGAEYLGYIDRRLYLEWYRGLTEELRAGAEFGGLPEVKPCGTEIGAGWAFVSGYSGKVVYPYMDGGQVQDIRTRSISDKDTMNNKPVSYLSLRGNIAERGALLPYMPSGDHSTIILSEGEFKRLVPLSQGCKHQVYSLRGASDPVGEMVQYFYGKTVILAFDNDEAGRLATVKQGRILRNKGIGVQVLDPAQLAPHKAIDNFVLAEGVEVFNNLLTPANLVTLPEFEATIDPELLKKMTMPKGDIGTERRWTPADHVDTFAHPEIENSVTPDEATDQIKEEVKAKIEGWKKGNGHLLVSAGAGVGKTTATMEAVEEYATEHGTVKIAAFLPNHSQIDEKIEDGTLEGFSHIYGRRWDKDEDGIRNCQQAETASTLTQLGYNVSSALCTTCDHLRECRKTGYISQFSGNANRAYVHAHIFTNYPESAGVAVIDEATHKTFIQNTRIYGGHLQRAIAEGIDSQAQKELIESLVMLFEVPNIETLTSIEFYTVLQRFYPELIDSIDQWGDGAAVQETLFDMVTNCTQSKDRNVYEVEQLPPAFAGALFSVLNEDVKRMAAGQLPTGRIKLVDAGSHRYIEIVSSRQLPSWYKKTPTILLNATANEVIARELWAIEGQLDILSPNVAMAEGNEIIQDVSTNNAKSGLWGNGDTTSGQRKRWIEKIRDHIGDHDPNDVVLVTVKPLAQYLVEAFPAARVAWYGALEGRNDLQAGMTILCNPPSINLAAIQDEARALWPGIDTTLTRASISYDNIQNEEGQYLAVEQVDAIDPRLSALIDQHRDALTIQAIGRARLVRNSGRRVVVMFSRPIPGHAPTHTIYTREQKQEYKVNKTLERLIAAAGRMLEASNSFSISTLAEAAGAARKTVHKYWQNVIDEFGINWIDLDCLQPMAGGGLRPVKVRLALNGEGQSTLKECIAEIKDHCMIHSLLYSNIGNGSYSDLAIPAGFLLDLKLPSPPAKLNIEEAVQSLPVEVEAPAVEGIPVILDLSRPIPVCTRQSFVESAEGLYRAITSISNEYKAAILEKYFFGWGRTKREEIVRLVNECRLNDFVCMEATI